MQCILRFQIDNEDMIYNRIANHVAVNIGSFGMLPLMMQAFDVLSSVQLYQLLVRTLIKHVRTQ